MKGGAIDVPAKPFRERDRLDAVHQAHARGLDDIDCVVSDVQMPGIDGLTLLERLRAIASAPPVILMTAFADDHVRMRALPGGAACFPAKPVDAEQLAESVRLACAGPG